ncbi:YidC/Oxa1 family insertase periplasmic-domain containing protein, partial [Candidatus Sumerlaeota bacterium]|nr:YidC/Oxa1 family insertase periplasmic-domain containing protein [Candidatus Sumerlaeota bacterium]
MDQQNRFLFLATTSLVLVLFYVVVLLPYQRKLEKYQRELAAYRKAHPEAAPTTATVTAERPVADLTSRTTVARLSPTTPTLEAQPPVEIVINTALYRTVLTLRGGRPTSWQYFDTIPGQPAGSSDKPPQSEAIEMIPQRESAPDQELPLDVEFSERPLDRAYTEFNTSVYQHEVVKGDDGSTRVIFTSPAIEQLQLIKTYTFRPDSYLTHLGLVLSNLDEKANRKIDNEGRGFGVAWGPGVREFPPDKPPTSRHASYITTLYGTAGRAGHAVPSVPGSDDQSEARGKKKQFYRGEVLWSAVADKFFLATIIPSGFKATQVNWVIRRRNLPDDQKASNGERFHSPPFTITLYNDPFLLAPKSQVAFDYEIFVGPKRPALLREIAKQTNSRLDEVLFYHSWFRWMRSLKLGLMYSLNFLNGVVHSYGLAIVILTVLVRIVMHPIAHKGM